MLSLNIALSACVSVVASNPELIAKSALCGSLSRAEQLPELDGSEPLNEWAVWLHAALFNPNTGWCK